MTANTTSPLDVELHIPTHLESVISEVSDLYDSEVAPREQALHHLLSDQSKFLDETGRLHQDIIAARREIMAAAGAKNIYSAHLPESLGGRGLGREDMIYVEEKVYGYGVGLNPALLSWSEGATPRLLHAHAHQKEQFTDPLVKGLKTSLHGVTETGAGSNLYDMKTNAVRKGSDWVLNGTKMFITNGVHADLYFIAAKTGDARHAMSMFIVEKGTPGFSVGRALKKTGWLSSDTAELVLDNVRIPDHHLLGEENKGFYSVMKNFQTERIALGAMAIGHCTRALELTLDYVRQRPAFGGTLWDKQVIRQRLAMLDAKTRSARQFMYHCAWSVTQDKDIVQEVSMLKALTGELVNEVVQTCQQFHGGMGYIRETAIERLWRDSRILGIGGGATEVMLDEVAKRY